MRFVESLEEVERHSVGLLTVATFGKMLATRYSMRPMLLTFDYSVEE